MALNRLSVAVGGDAAAVTEWTPAAGAAVRFSHGLPDSFAEQYPRYAVMDPFLAAMRRTRTLSVSVDGEADPAPSPFQRAFLAKQGLWYRAGTMLVDNVDERMFLTVFRAKHTGPFCDRSTMTLGSLVPHLRNAAKLVERIERQEMHLALYRDALDCTMRGIAAVDGAGRVVYANARAHAILTANDGFVAGVDELRARRASDDRRLQTMLAIAFDVADGRKHVEDIRPVMISKGVHGRSYVVRAQPLSPAARSRQARTMLVLIRDPLTEPNYDERTIVEHTGFTMAEARIARQIVQGMTIAEAAKALGVSPNTVRTHLRSMFAKSGVNRQVDLVRVITMTLGYRP